MFTGCNHHVVLREIAITDTAEANAAAVIIQKIVESSAAFSPAKTPAPLQTPIPEGFQCKKDICEAFTLTPTQGSTLTPTLSEEFFHGSWNYDLLAVSQTGLKYRGVTNNYGCAPASVQMVLGFWHDIDEKYPEMTAQEILDLASKNGEFDPKSGMNITDLADDLSKMGYYFGTVKNSNKEDLLAALKRYGPLIILTKTHWMPTSTNHMAVLIHYDPETDIVRLNDPYSDGFVEFSYDAFDGIWGLNYTGNEESILRRTFFFIVPKDQIRPGNDLFIP